MEAIKRRVSLIYTVMYTGQIFYQGNPITVQQAVDLSLIAVDENGDIWLFHDPGHMIKITGDLQLG